MTTAGPAFPPAALSAIADEIAELFGDEGFARPGQAIIVGPPIEVYTAGMIDAHEPPLLSDVAHSTERFHHQVLDTNRLPLGYALTRFQNGGVIVCKLSSAAEFAAAIERGLNMLRHALDKDHFVRLLSVPELQLDALWALGPAERDAGVLIVSSPSDRSLELKTLSAPEIVDVLMRHQPLVGVYVTNLTDLSCDNSLLEVLGYSIGDTTDLVDDAPPVTLIMLGTTKETVP